jgi:tetratricopeptide (TPR) repeat protein
VQIFERSSEIAEKRGEKENIVIDLGNLAFQQILIGELDTAESNLSRSINICRKIKDEFREAIGHLELGQLLAYRKEFAESEKELSNGMKGFVEAEKIDLGVAKAWQGTNWADCSFVYLLMSNADKALNYAKKARELANVEIVEADIIRAEYLLGAAYFMKGNLVEAEKHLIEALTRDKKINLVELEPDILLEFAKLRFKQDHKEEALKFADAALQIADRCEYRLKQADIHIFLAEFYMDASDLEKARKHSEIAKGRAECGYKVALEKAEKMLRSIEKVKKD